MTDEDFGFRIACIVVGLWAFALLCFVSGVMYDQELQREKVRINELEKQLIELNRVRYSHANDALTVCDNDFLNFDKDAKHDKR